MIVAAAAAPPPATNGLPFNWFDLAVVMVLLFGLFRGRRNGMAKELLPLMQWLALVPICGLGYDIVAGPLSGIIKDVVWRCVVSYLALALVVLIAFALLKRQFAEKLVKSDKFKSGEYYLGMLSGLVRYAGMVIVALALLNAPIYTPKMIQDQRERDQQNFGGGPGSGFSGNFFPHVSTVQRDVFKESFLGPLIKENLGILLIKTDRPGVGGPTPTTAQPVIQIGN